MNAPPCLIAAAIGRLEKIPRGGLGKAMEAEAALLSMSPKTLRTKYDAFRRGEFDVMFDRRHGPMANPVREGVKALFGELCRKHDFNHRKAFAELLSLHAQSLPAGLEWPPLDVGTGMPRGCSFRNMLRMSPRRERGWGKIGRAKETPAP